MSLVKLAKFRSDDEIEDAYRHGASWVKDNYVDKRTHWQQTKGKWIGVLFGGLPGLGIGHLYDKKKRREAFIGPEGKEQFIYKFKK